MHRNGACRLQEGVASRRNRFGNLSENCCLDWGVTRQKASVVQGRTAMRRVNHVIDDSLLINLDARLPMAVQHDVRLRSGVRQQVGVWFGHT